ncbi:dihydroorotase [Synechocystis sp. LKSZ1]|uniref:dihydroorotase n=1 Tax=Synechocystis sp. LKSZ1 TaxID=3144951 RepID=UPI00336BBF0F
MESQYLRGVRWLEPQQDQDCQIDLWLQDGQIQALNPDPALIPAHLAPLNGEHLILAPGLVDLYSTSGEPGHEDRETLSQLAAAAITGGFTQLVLLPQGQPVSDNPAVLSLRRQKLLALAPQSLPHVHFWGSLTQDARGEQLAELADLVEAGVVGFSDGQALMNSSLIRRALEYLAPYKKTLALVPVNLALRGNGVAREGAISLALGLPGEPAMAETTAISALIEIMADLPTPVHLMRVSTQRGVALIAQAQARGLPLTASVAWMHILLDSQALYRYDPNLHLDPPLGNPEDRLALIQGLKDGTIAAIAVDHQAYTYEEKTLAFAESPAGAIGLEFALPCLWQGLVETGHLTALELWRALSLNPLRCLGLNPVFSDWLLFNPQQSWPVNSQTLKTQARNTPWWGQTITGRVEQVLSWATTANPGL